MANNLGFEYTLNVNEKATKQNLNAFIKNTFGEGKNAKLSVPIKIDISNSISDIDFKRLQKDIDNNVQNNLKVKAKIEVDVANIRNQIQSQMKNIQKDLKFKVGLEIDPSAINIIAGTVDVMKTLNAEIDKVKNNMKELNKNLTINIGDVHLGKQYDEILQTSKEIKDENKETEASLEEQLNIQKRILEEKRNQMKQTEKDIKAEKDRLDLAKERKANNDKLIEQEKQLRKEADNLNEQIKAEQDRQKLYEKQNDALKKQSKDQEKLADGLKKTNEEIKKLEEDKTSAQQRVNLAKEEEERRANNLAMMKKENEALKEKLANLQKIANVTNETTTSNKTSKTSKGTSIKQQADNTIKQVADVSNKRIEEEKKVTKEIENQSKAQINAMDKVIKAEDKVNKAKEKTNKKASSSTSSTQKPKGRGKQVLYDRVQSADISKAIHDETVKGVRSLQEEEAEMRRLGNMVADERGLLKEVGECLERNKELTKENADEVQNLLTKLADEKTLIQETAGNRDYVDKQPFKKALKAYLADSNDENLAKLEFQAEKLGKIGGMYEYRMDIQEAINKLQKQYNIEAQRSLEIEEKQQQINEKRISRATNIQSKATENKVGFDAKKLKYRDAGSFVKEEMYGFSADELAKAIEKYDDALQPFMDASGFHIDYGKTDAYIADVKDKVEKLTVAMNNATDTQKIEAYNAKIEKLNKNITILQKTVNTYEHIDALMKMKEGVTFDLGEEKSKDVNLDKILNLKEIVSEFTQYSKGVNLTREQTSKVRQDLSWLAKDFDKLAAEKSMDEEKWQSLADKTQQYKKELGVTEDQIKQFINTKNEEIQQGNEHLAKLKELQRTLKRGTNEYRECSKVVKDYNNALENDLPITGTIKDMKELINILDKGKDSINSFDKDTKQESSVKIVKQQTRDFKELFEVVANGKGTVQETLDLFKMMLDENYKANEALKYKKDLTEDDRKELQRYAEVTNDCVKALTTMKQNMDGVAKGVQSCTKQYLQSTDKLKENYDILYKVSDKNEKVSDTEKELNNTTDKQVESTTKANQALNEQYGILIQLARGAGIAESKMSDLVMRITNAAAASKKLSKTEIGKLAKDFPSANLLGQKQARTNLVELGRKNTNGVRYNTTDDYKNQKQQIDALVDNAMDNLSDVFRQMFDEAKRIDKQVELLGTQHTKTTSRKTDEQEQLAQAIDTTTQAQEKQMKVAQDNAKAIEQQAKATEKLAKAQEKIETSPTDSDSLNKENTLKNNASNSANIKNVAVDEQQTSSNKKIEVYNKQIDIMLKEAALSEKVSESKAKQIQQEEKISEVVEESTENYKQAYEEAMRLIEASKEYAKLSKESSEKIDFQDLRDRAETVGDDDIAQWKEMYQLSLALGDEMELNIERERSLNKIKQQTLEKTKALLSDGRTTEQYWKDEKEAIEKESLAIEENISIKKQEANVTEQSRKDKKEAIEKESSAIKENINTKKQEANVTEQVAQAEAKSSKQAKEVVSSKNKVAKASKNVTDALKEEQQVLATSTNVKDHIQATLVAIDKVNKSATFKKKAKEDSTLQDMFNELKREANINKSSGILGIDYWDGLIDRIKIFATEMVKMKAKTIDDAVNPLIYKDGGTTSTTKATSSSKPLSREEFKAQQEEKAKQREIRRQEREAQKLKEQQEEAKALETVLKQLENSITNNPHTQLLKVYEDIAKITDAQERFNKILEITGLNYDEIYKKTLKSEKAHAQNSGGIDIDKIFTEQLASFNRDNNPYNTLNYMSEANIKGFNDRVEYVAEYSAKEKIVQEFINGIKRATDGEKEFIAQQELEIKTVKAYPSEAKKMIDAQHQMAEANQEISTKSKKLVDNLENTTTQIESSKKGMQELASITKNIDIDTLKDKFGRTWKEIAEEQAKFLKKSKEDIIMFELYNMEMDNNYSDRDDERQKRYKPLNYMKDVDINSAKTPKEAIPILSEYYAKIQVLTELKKQEEQLASQITQDLKESNKELDKAIDKTKNLAIPLENMAIPLENKKTKNKKGSTRKSNESNNTKPTVTDNVTTTDEVNKAKDLQDTTNNIKNINKEIVDTKQEDKQITQVITNEVEKQVDSVQKQVKVEEQKQVIDEKSKQIKQNVTNEIEKQTQAEDKASEAKQEKVKVENEEIKALQEQIAKNEQLIKQEEEAMQDAKETATMHEMEVATINYKIKQAKELRDEQEKQLANADTNSEKTKEEYQLQTEAWKRIGEKINILQEEKRLKEQMANDLKKQIMQEKMLGNTSEDALNSMIERYNKLQQEAKDTQKSIELITKAIQNQENAKTKANLPSSTPTSGLPKNNNNGNNNNNNNNGGGGGNNIPPRNNNGGNNGNNTPPELSEYIKLKQRALMLDIENLVYGKELTDNQKLMVNELVEQVVQLGRSVTSMKELSLEAQKIKQNINETKFDVKVSTTEDKDAKKLLEQQRKEKEAMYKSLFDQRIAEIEAEEKYVKEMTSMYAKLFDQAEHNAQVEERAKVVLEDKIAKQKELWQLKVKEFSQSDNSNYVDPKDLANMKEMANNIGNNITNMRELNQQLHKMNMAYKEISSNSKNTKAMFNDAEKAMKEAEANKEAQKALKQLIATKEEDLRQTHQNIQNSKVYQNSSENLRREFDALIDKMKLTGATTEEVNAQYKQFSQQMNGMKINMVTSQLGQHEGILKKVCSAMKQYITMNFDVIDMFNYLQRGFSNAFEHTKTLDEAYTNISMTMSVTNKQFQTMVDTAMKVGNANGQLETSVLEMMKVYANAGTTVEQINDQMKATVAFQNVTDLDASTVTQSIQTIIQQYKLTESGAMDAAEATEYLGDVMVAVAYDLAKEESVAMQEVVSGIETAGNMIKTSGGSFEWFTSVIGTLSEVMNASGSETANAMKMIAARTLKSKEAIEELAESGEDMEDIEIAASNAELALNSIGLTARTQTGDFKDLEVILGEVASKWDTLSNATQQYVSEQMAGNNRRSF